MLLTSRWINTGELGASAFSSTVGSVHVEQEDRRGLQSPIDQVVSRTTIISVQNLLIADNLVDWMEQVTGDTLVAQVMGDRHDTEQFGDAPDTPYDTISLLLFKQELAALALCKKMCSIYDVPDAMRRQLASGQ